MMNFDTLTVPPPFTDHNLMHNTIRHRSLGQKGLQVRFREKRPFRAIFVGYNTRFLALGSIFLQHPGCGQTPFRRHLGEVFIDFLSIWCTFQAFSARLGAFVTENYFSKRKPK
jgi:hypothetical protein